MPPGSGVAVNRYVTRDFKTYSAPMTVLLLPDGGGPGMAGASGASTGVGGTARAGSGDGVIWTVKSMDRSPTGYLLCATGNEKSAAAAACRPCSLCAGPVCVAQHRVLRGHLCVFQQPAHGRAGQLQADLEGREL